MNNKYFLHLVVVFMLLLTGCSSDDSGSPNESGEATSTIIFENSDYNGSAVVTYTDGATREANFSKGVLKISISDTGDKVIKSINPENQGDIRIGRKEGDSIRLNYFNGVLRLRGPIDGLIPIGSYDEFQLINSNEITLAEKYFLESSLDLMNENWQPIGSVGIQFFKGEFYGRGHELYNLNINSSSFEAVGLFSRVDHAKIRGITIKSGQISINKVGPSNCYAGGVVGFIVEGSVTDCSNYAKITLSASGGAKYYGIGGIVGSANYVSNCHNFGDIIVTGLAENTGGVIGRHETITELDMIIANCSNYGSISVDKGNVGGILGRGFVINNCINEGDVTQNLYSDVVSYSGGIVGIGNVSRCKNTASVKGLRGVGGIAGIMMMGFSEPNDNVNYGAIVGEEAVGGIAGYAFSSDAGPRNSNNFGNVFGNKFVGGTVGCTSYQIIIENCANSGSVNGTGNYIGGILGGSENSSGRVLNCNNSGAVNGMSIIGGLAGQGRVENSYNQAMVSGIETVGGVIGEGIVINSYNTGKVMGTADAIGGIVGVGCARKCHNTGEVKGASSVGGIIGGMYEDSFNIDIEGCYNTGNVIGTGQRIGGIVGVKSDSSKKIIASYNKGNISGDASVGGIAGFYNALHYPIMICYNTGTISGTNIVGGLVGNLSNITNNSIYQSYNVGSVYGTAYVGGLAGNASSLAGSGGAGRNFWKDIANDDAEYVVGGNPNIASQQFSSTIWPSNYGWTITPSTWKNLGNWNGGNPAYPQLYFE